MVSLYCGLNLLFNVVKRPSVVLHFSCSVCGNISKIVDIFYLANFLWLLCVLLVACYKILIYCLPLVWSFWVHYICLLLPSWMLAVSLWVCIVWILHWMFFLPQQQPWPVLSSLLFQPVPALLLHWHLSVHLPFSVHVFFLLMYAFETFISFSFPLPLWHFHFWHHIVFLALLKITLIAACMYIYFYYVNLCLCL